jgi:hypothetical protein
VPKKKIPNENLGKGFFYYDILLKGVGLMEQPIEYPIDEILVMSNCVESIKKLKEFGYSFEFIINLTVKAFNSDKNVSSRTKENNDSIVNNKPDLIEKTELNEKDSTNKSSPPPSQEDNIQKKKSSLVPRKKHYTDNPIRLFSEEEELSSIDDNSYQYDANNEPKFKSEHEHEVKIEYKTNPKQSPLICTRCSNTGHVERFCRINTDVTCLKCNKMGHFASRCDISCSICQQRGHTDKNHGKFCDFCKRFNHTTSECWKKNKVY